MPKGGFSVSKKAYAYVFFLFFVTFIIVAATLGSYASVDHTHGLDGAYIELRD